MVDCENEVYTKVATALRTAISNISISGDYSVVPSSFPHVFLYESDNSVVTRYTGNSGSEMDQVTFTVEVYSNKASGKKTEAKKIMNAIDAVMYSINAERLSKMAVPNLNNASIFRYVARYRVLTDGVNFYRR